MIFIGLQLFVSFLAAVVFGIVLGFQLVAAGKTIDPTMLLMADDFLLDFHMWFLLIASVIGIVVFALMWRKERICLPTYDNTKLRALPVTLTILAFAGLNYILVSIVALTDLTRYFPSYELVEQLLGSGGFVVRILVIGLLGPVLEELVCRGFVFNRLCCWMPKWAAVLVGSALFGVIHFNLFQALYAFVLGILFSLVYIHYRNIWIPIIAHVAFNLANIVLIEVLEAAGAGESSAWILLIPSVLIVAACITLLLKRTKAAVLVQEPEIETDTIIRINDYE